MLTLNVLVLILLGFLLLPFHDFCRSRYALLLMFVPLAMFAFFLTKVPIIDSGQSISEQHQWLPQLGVELSFVMDGLSFLFSLLITGIGGLVILYSVGYMDRHQHLSRYFSYLFLFMGAMLGLVLADNLITLFVFWEVTSVTSFLLIGFKSDKEISRESAITALLVTSAGALVMLFAFVMIHSIAHTYTISEILKQKEIFQHHEWYLTILILLLFGVFTKSAQFPFYFWLPNAMQAPTPISAYLHSATMVQAGVYLLARLHPVMANYQSWFVLLSLFGATTMFVGSVLAFRQNDMKLILAYTTVTALGSLVFLLGSSEEMVIKAAIAFFISHALYKATLFMVVGDIQHQTSTRNITEISGLRHAMPVTFLATIVAAASMAGLPPLLGFYVKELVYEANIAAPIARDILIVVVVLANMLVAALSFVLVLKPFMGKQKPLEVHEANRKMSVNAFLLSLLTLLLSIFPFTIDRSILSPAASAVLGRHVEIKLSLWHGLTPSLVLSIITLLGAIVIYQQRLEFRKLIERFRFLYSHGPACLWDLFMTSSLSFAKWLTAVLQNGKQRIYLTIILSAVAILMFFTIISQNGVNIAYIKPDLNLFSVFLFIWIVGSALAVIGVDTYLRGLVFLGMFGLGVALLFLIDAAPDVAMTQVLVETLIVIIVVLNISGLPVLPKIGSEPLVTRLFNMVIAAVFGLTITLLLLTITHTYFNPEVSNYYLANSVKIANGHNVVNVILVDFRAMDTLGEIVVVAAAAIGIFAMLRKSKKDSR